MFCTVFENPLLQNKSTMYKRFFQHYVLVLIGLLFAFNAGAVAQLPDEIKTALETGNSKTLSNYFNQSIELVVLDNDNVYSKAQARQILDNFFQKYTPKKDGFSVVHKGGNKGAQSVIGNLLTEQGNFRIYFLLKNNNGKEYIHQLRIEKK